MLNFKVVLVLVAGGLVWLTGCVEDKRLGKYDTHFVSEEKLVKIDKVELAEAADQSMELPEEYVKIAPGEVNELTLEECRVLALQNNLTLKVDSYSPMIAKESLKQAHAKFEPLFISGLSFASSESFVKNDDYDVYSESDGMSAEGKVSVPLVTGGELSFSVPFSKSETDSTVYYTDETSGLPASARFEGYGYGAGTSFQLRQPLLKGAGVSVNTHNIRLSSYNLKSSIASSKLSTMTVLVAVDKAYWNLYASQETLKVRELEYELARKQYDRAVRMLDLKQVKQIDVLRAENSMARSRTAIVTADNGLRKSQRQLKQILNAEGLEVESDSVVVAAMEPVSTKYELDKDKLLEYALANRVELLQYELQLASQESTLEYQKNSLLPSLALNYVYNFDGDGETFSAAMDDLDDRVGNSQTVGLSLSVPLGNRSAKSSYRSAIISKQQIMASKELKELAVKNEVLGAMDNLNSGWSSVLTTANSVVIAKRTMDAEERQYELGMQTSTEVLRVQAEYASALLSKLEAVVAYQVAQIDLCYAVGGLNEAAQVSVNSYQ